MDSLKLGQAYETRAGHVVTIDHVEFGNNRPFWGNIIEDGGLVRRASFSASGWYTDHESSFDIIGLSSLMDEEKARRAVLTKQWGEIAREPIKMDFVGVQFIDAMPWAYGSEVACKKLKAHFGTGTAEYTPFYSKWFYTPYVSEFVVS